LSSLKSKILAALAALTMAGGTAAIAVPAHAESPSCGSTCVDLFSYGPGSNAADPSYLLDSYKQEQGTGSPVILFATSNTDPAEDFTAQSPDPVSDYLQAGLVGEQVALHYGCNPGIDFSQCSSNGGVGVNDYATELEYSPFGAPTGECAGVAATATAGEKVTLQPCGVSGKTLWIFDSLCFVDAPTITPVAGSGTFKDECTYNVNNGTVFNAMLYDSFPLINGSDTNFSQPFVLTYPNGASPLSVPRTGAEVENLTTFANPETGLPNGDVDFGQLWGARFGTVTP
jgi:hypothetical protein